MSCVTSDTRHPEGRHPCYMIVEVRLVAANLFIVMVFDNIIEDNPKGI